MIFGDFKGVLKCDFSATANGFGRATIISSSRPASHISVALHPDSRRFTSRWLDISVLEYDLRPQRISDL